MRRKADGANVEDGPGVRVPPPLVVLTGFAAAAAVGALVDLPPLPRSSAAGPAVVIFGAALIFWSAGLFRRSGTAIAPTRRAETLVRDGPYRYSRNPIYLGFVGVYVGLALWLRLLAPLLVLPIVVMVLQRRVIEREERHLRARFGHDFERYEVAVRRWL